MKTLYLGTDPSHYAGEGEVVHYPVIRIVPRSAEDPEVRDAFSAPYTHLILTSKQAAKIYFALEQHRPKVVFAIGAVTAATIQSYGCKVDYIPEEATQEGLIALLERLDLQDPSFFLPRSSLARPLLTDYLLQRGWRTRILDLYETVPQKREPVPDLSHFQRIVFTSPSTVRAFIEIFGALPGDKELVSIGPITQNYLDNR